MRPALRTWLGRLELAACDGSLVPGLPLEVTVGVDSVRIRLVDFVRLRELLCGKERADTAEGDRAVCSADNEGS